MKMNQSCTQCSKNGGCPFAFYTEESNYIQNLGCLPTPYEIISMRQKHNKTWACHNNPSKPCLGAINFQKEKGLPFDVVDKVLITEDSDWHKLLKITTNEQNN